MPNGNQQAGPWQDYQPQQAQPQTGPWQDYQTQQPSQQLPQQQVGTTQPPAPAQPSSTQPPTRQSAENLITQIAGGGSARDIGRALPGAGLDIATDVAKGAAEGVGDWLGRAAPAVDRAAQVAIPANPEMVRQSRSYMSQAGEHLWNGEYLQAAGRALQAIGTGVAAEDPLFKLVNRLVDIHGAVQRAATSARAGLSESLGQAQMADQAKTPSTDTIAKSATSPAQPPTQPTTTTQPQRAPRADAKPGPYTTQLSASDEQQFQNWVKQNNIPWQDSPTADYDMRGFWKAMNSGDPEAQRNAQTGHFPDTYKTPYHDSFSNESKYATKDAPIWRGNNQLVNKQGQVVFDESVEPIIRQAAADTGLPAKLIRSVITQESNFKADALGQPTKTGERAQGMMQLMPETIRQMKVKDPFNAEENIRAGARWLKMKIDAQGGDIRKGVKAYYGTGKPKTGPDPEDYTTQVMSRYGSR